MESQDPEDRVAELEQQLREARAAAWRGDVGGSASTGIPNSYAEKRYSSDGPDGTELAPAPRPIPIGFWLAEILPFRWWYLFAMFLAAVPPIIVWIMQPALVLPAAVVVLLAIYAFQVRGLRTRTAILRWGRVATVTDTEVISRGTYYGGTTYSNVVLPVARGWTVSRPMWSGPKTKTRIRYELDDYRGELIVGGREYVDGVILADQRRPERALCVTSFPYDLDRDDSGNWLGRLRVRLQIGMACWLLIVCGWIGGAALLYSNHETHRVGPSAATPVGTTPTHVSTTTAAPGQAIIINGANELRSIVCNANDVTVNGSANVVDITGHCLNVTVSGSANHVSLDVADSITANGIDNRVTFRAGSPQIVSGGISNVVEPG